MSLVTRVELIAVGVSVLLGLIGFMLDIPPLELLGIVGAVFSFGILVASAFGADSRGS